MNAERAPASPSPPSPPSPPSALDVGVLARALGLLAVEAASVVLFHALLLVVGDLPSFLEKNALAPVVRDRVVLACVGLPALVVAIAAVAIRRRGPRAAQTALELAGALSFLIPLGVLPALFNTQLWFRQRLAFVALLALYGLLVERTLRHTLATVESAPWLEGLARAFADARAALRRPGSALLRAPFHICLALAAAYAAYTGYLCVLNHHRMGTGAFDLAIENNIVYGFLHGQGYASSVMYGDRGGSALADHARISMIAFLPLYALWPKAEALLVFQALAIGGAAVPLFLFARTRLSDWTALFVAAAYLLYAPMHAAQFYDFHWLPPAVFFHFLLFWAIATNRTKVVLVTLPLLLGMREDVAPGVVVLGLFLLFTGARPRLGGAMAATAAAYFVVLKFVVMPRAGTWWFEGIYGDLIGPGDHGYGAVLKTLATNPVYVVTTLFKEAKLEYLLHVLAPLAFVPFRRAKLLPLAIPGIFFTVLTSEGACFSLGYQYITHWVPYLFGALVLSLEAMPDVVGARHRSAAMAAITVVMVAHTTVLGVVIKPTSFAGGKPLTQLTLTAEEREAYEAIREIGLRIPDAATVAATDYEAPHFSSRIGIYAVAQDDTAGQFLVLNTRSFHLANTRGNIRSILAKKPYRFVMKRGNNYVFEQGPPTPETPAAIRAMGL